MAETDITPTTLVMNTASADIADADAVVPSVAADGWNVLAGGRNGDRLLLKFVADGSSRTVTIKAGARPPSSRADLGDLAISLAANDVKYVAVEAARFLRANGTILVTASNAAVKMGAFIMPKGLVGTSA